MFAIGIWFLFVLTSYVNKKFVSSLDQETSSLLGSELFRHPQHSPKVSAAKS